MFGKKKDEYEGDYIRPSEEYIESSSHEDGLSYENHNSEQQSYDNYANVEQSFAKCLMRDEQLIWAGEKQKGAKQQGGCIALFFPLVWTLFSCFWTFTATISGGIFGLFGVPFIIIGIYMFKTMSGASKESYAITNKRVIRRSGARLLSENLENICNITFTDNGNGKGNVSYSVQNNNISMQGSSRLLTKAYVNLYNVENPNEVCRNLRSAVYSATNGRITEER